LSRRARVERKTLETLVVAELDLDGQGRCEASTGLPFFDHLLETMCKFSGFDCKISVDVLKRADDHHVVEDVGIALGLALKSALGSGEGLARFASAVVPMDESLAFVAVDVSGRPYCLFNADFERDEIGGVALESLGQFLLSLASSASITIHAHVLYGRNDHHKAEALFKALGLALGSATRISSRGVPSTKGVL